MTDTYVTTLTVDDMFIDPEYQRELDAPRARKYTAAWDRRLAGILEVSDRGPDTPAPRYAIIDGQHRWVAAQNLEHPPLLVVNVHEGLSIAQEAELWDKLNRERRRPSTWDHWRARRGSGDPDVTAIEDVVTKLDLRVNDRPIDGNVRCTATLEKVVALGGTTLLEDTLSLLAQIWGRRLDAFDAPIVHGLAMVLHFLDDRLEQRRLAEALIEVSPRQVKARAQAMRETQSGSLGKLCALTIVGFYNARPGRNLSVRPSDFETKRPTPVAAVRAVS